MSRDDVPMRSSNSPGSTVHACAATSQNANARSSSASATSCDCAGVEPHLGERLQLLRRPGDRRSTSCT